MGRETFFYAYAGQVDLCFGIDLIDKYESTEIKSFKNYISCLGLSPSKIASLLQDYKISVEGDVKFSGSQNDMQYFFVETERGFDGLIEAFGNSRVALLCGHYTSTGEYERVRRSELLRKIYVPESTITWVSVVLENYYREPFTQSDEELIKNILEKFQEIIGMEIGICCVLEKKTGKTLELLSVDNFIALARDIREHSL